MTAARRLKANDENAASMSPDEDVSRVAHALERIVSLTDSFADLERTDTLPHAVDGEALAFETNRSAG